MFNSLYTSSGADLNLLILEFLKIHLKKMFILTRSIHSKKGIDLGFTLYIILDII